MALFGSEVNFGRLTLIRGSESLVVCLALTPNLSVNLVSHENNVPLLCPSFLMFSPCHGCGSKGASQLWQKPWAKMNLPSLKLFVSSILSQHLKAN